MAATRNEQLAEETAQKNRSKNLIIHGRHETTPNDDKKFMEEISVEVDSNMPSKIERVGQLKEGKTRPIRMEFKNTEDKEKFYGNLGKLKGKICYQGIHITDDFTYNERMLIRDFSEQAKSKNLKENNSDYVWRVRGSPKNGLFLKRFMKVNTETNQSSQQ